MALVKGLVPAVVALVAVVSGCGGGNGGSTTTNAQGDVKVQLQEQSFSGEAGTVTLSPQGEKTRVDVVLASYAANDQPAHIHKGTCASLNPTPAYPLHDLVAGKSVTVVPISLSHLLAGTYAINVHRSAKKLDVYVACGNISRNAAPTPTITTPEDDD